MNSILSPMAALPISFDSFDKMKRVPRRGAVRVSHLLMPIGNQRLLGLRVSETTIGSCL